MATCDLPVSSAGTASAAALHQLKQLLQHDSAFARALRLATEIDPRRSGAIPSSKGVLERAGS